MEYLFDSKGRHIATFINDQLYAPSGENIGHYLEKEEIFIDFSGYYFGEIVFDNRLMYNRSSPYKSNKFIRYGDCGSLVSYGSPTKLRISRVMPGFDDVMESVD
jgi:hypothetical protein